MSSDETSEDPGNSRSWRWTLIAVAAVPALGVGALLAMGALFHDCGEVQAWPRWQVFSAALDLRRTAQAAGGRFPEGGEEVQRVLDAMGDEGCDPWGRPYRYDRLEEEGERARVYTLGRDGAPGGEDCAGDIVVWVDLEDEHVTSDVRELPVAWRKGEPSQGLGTPGIR